MVVKLRLLILRSGRVKIEHNFGNKIRLLCGGINSIYKRLNQRIWTYLGCIFNFILWGIKLSINELGLKIEPICVGLV